MEDGKCTKQFAKDFVDKAFTGNGYPYYRRRNDGQIVMKNGVPLDNRYVEICSSIKSCKYLYKYVYKGPDMASVAVTSGNNMESQEANVNKNHKSNPEHVDEIEKYVNSRFITASEGFWRICAFDVHGREPSIQCLAVHENSQIITFNERNPKAALSNPQETTLLAWFKLNHSDPKAVNYKYHEIPEHYVWNRNFSQVNPKEEHCVALSLLFLLRIILAAIFCTLCNFNKFFSLLLIKIALA